MKKLFYLPGMKSDVSKFVLLCNVCKLNKSEHTLTAGLLQRLLEVDNRIVVPIDTHIRFLVTGADVIHDFAMPSLGLKVDAFPGRLNQTSVLIEHEGVFYGQSSEIFGVYHGFMPAVIEAVTPEKYLLSR